jgi:hypothetical protein
MSYCDSTCRISAPSSFVVASSCANPPANHSLKKPTPLRVRGSCQDWRCLFASCSNSPASSRSRSSTIGPSPKCAASSKRGGAVVRARCLRRAGHPRSGWRAEVKRAKRALRAELTEVRLERPCPGDVTQPRERLFLDLPHPLARDPQERADLLERHRLLVIQPEIQAQDLRLTLFQV